VYVGDTRNDRILVLSGSTSAVEEDILPTIIQEYHNRHTSDIRKRLYQYLVYIFFKDSEDVLGLLYKMIFQLEVTCVAFISVSRSEILQKIWDLWAINNACVYSMGWLRIGIGGGRL